LNSKKRKRVALMSSKTWKRRRKTGKL